jgi:hypothetical protein
MGTIRVAATTLNLFGERLEALRLRDTNPPEGPPEVGPESEWIRENVFRLTLALTFINLSRARFA